ncbi:MAG TPA: DUF1697 domain-containing protein [Micromonosporaceae bacterium]|jgi:uncharacterized protein (DUF1697 family)
MRYAVLLRGVNVAGNRKVAMADVRRVLESLGYADVSTYLQSGNAVISADKAKPDALERRIEKALASELGVDTRVLVRTHAELEAVIGANPFPAALAEPKFLHVVFLTADPTPAAVARMNPAAYAPDEIEFGDRAAYVRYARGQGRSKLTPAVWNRLGVAGTARNWNTVGALARLTAP